MAALSTLRLRQDGVYAVHQRRAGEDEPVFNHFNTPLRDADCLLFHRSLQRLGGDMTRDNMIRKTSILQ